MQFCSLSVGECFGNLINPSLQHLLVQGLLQNTVRFGSSRLIVQLGQFFADQRRLALHAIDVFGLHVIGQRLFGAFNFCFQLPRRTIQPFRSAGELFDLLLEGGFDVSVCDCVGYTGG